MCGLPSGRSGVTSCGSSSARCCDCRPSAWPSAFVVLILAGRALEGLLFGVRAADPVTIVTVTAVLGAVALLAAWAPALRASKVDPIEALRYE